MKSVVRIIFDFYIMTLFVVLQKNNRKAAKVKELFKTRKVSSVKRNLPKKTGIISINLNSEETMKEANSEAMEQGEVTSLPTQVGSQVILP